MGTGYDMAPPVESTACFTGHRHLSEPERRKLSGLLPDAVEALYRLGYRTFLCGGALGFDTMAAEAVLRIRERLPEISLHLVVPCAGQSDRWAPADREVYRRICGNADRVFVLSGFYYVGCMLTRNRYMVDHASLCVGYMRQAAGGTWTTIRYALQQKKPVVNLAIPHAIDQDVMLKEQTWNYTFIFPSVSGNVNIVRLHPLQPRLRKKGRSISERF